METRTRRIYVVRHGVTLWNREMRFQGHTDIPLHEEGQEQARRIAARLAVLPSAPVAVWSSDLARARHTAEAIATPHGLNVCTTALLRETMLGDWEGLTRAEIEARGDSERLALYIKDPFQHRPPGGETLEAVWDRIAQASELLCREHPEGDLVIVGHGGSLRALLCQALDTPLASLRRLRLDNASLSVIEEQHGVHGSLRWLTLLNDTSHL